MITHICIYIYIYKYIYIKDATLNWDENFYAYIYIYKRLHIYIYINIYVFLSNFIRGRINSPRNTSFRSQSRKHSRTFFPAPFFTPRLEQHQRPDVELSERLASPGVRYGSLPETHRTSRHYRLRGLRRVLNWTSIMSRDSSLSDNEYEFF